MPKVSVVIPTYNYGRYISKAIDSVLSQTFKDFEIIVIDDGSTDGTKDLPAQYGNKIKYIYQENHGLSNARNRGIKASSGEYLVFLDADDYISPQKLETETKLLDAHPEVGWSYSNHYYVDENGIILYGFSYQFHKSNSRPPEGMIFKDLLLNNFIPVNAVMLRKKCLDAGFFDESLGNQGYEDCAFWLRVSAKYEVKYIDQPLAFIRLHKGSMREDVVGMVSNKIIVIRKICKLYPDLTRPYTSRLKAILAGFYNQVAHKNYEERRFKESISELLNSIRYRPIQKTAYLYLISALLKSLGKKSND